LGQTDYNMYATCTMPTINTLIRIDLCPHQLARHSAEVAIIGEAAVTLTALNDSLHERPNGLSRAFHAVEARSNAFEEIGSEMRALNEILNAVRDTIPGAIIVGASAYPIYAGNLYYDHDRPDGWFNAATGFGALGYGIPAAIGAALAALDTPSDPYNWRWRCSV